MIDIESILLEWSVRCEKGYPDINNSADWQILNEIMATKNYSLSEIISSPESNHLVNENDARIPDELKNFYNALPEEKRPEFVEFIEKMPKNLLNSFKQGFKNLNQAEITKAVKAFKSLDSVENLINQSYKEYQFIWDIYVPQAIGNGELYISLMVKNAVVQGSSESFDIAAGGKRYEVKSLDVFDTKTGKTKIGVIRPGTEGKVDRHSYFTNPLTSLASIIYNLQDESLKSSILALGDPDKMKTILDIINKTSVVRPKAGELIFENPGNVPTTLLNGLYKAAVELNKESKDALRKDITTSRISINSATIKATYWVTDQEIEDIIASSESDKPVSIKVGVAVNDETKDAKFLLVDLLNHPFVKNPNQFIEGLNKIKERFFGNKNGLVYFLQGKTLISRDMSEFATVESSMGGYRFGLKTKYNKYEFVTKQT
jgi:hypothetical protein